MTNTETLIIPAPSDDDAPECEHENWSIVEAEEYVYGASIAAGPYRTVLIAVCDDCHTQGTLGHEEEMDEDGYVSNYVYPEWD